MVDRVFSSNQSSAYLLRRAVLPTPEGPTSITLKVQSQARCIINQQLLNIDLVKYLADPRILQIQIAEMISRNTINELCKYLKSSSLIFPNQNEWVQANKRFGLHALSPAAILKAKEWADISESIRFCNKHSIPFAIKGGGVNQASSCVRKDALTIDLSQFKEISHRYNGKQLAITLGSGINFKDLYDYIYRFNKQENAGFITPMAWYEDISCIGAFSILGNGVVQRKIGVGVDLIKQAKVMISSGQIVTANQRENSDLLWAIRGCGPHFGAILEITIELNKGVFDHFKKDVKNNLKVHSFSIPFIQKTIGIQIALLNFLLKMDPRIICYIGFNGNWKESNIYLVLSQVLTSDNSQDHHLKQSVQGQSLADLVKGHNGKNHFAGKEFIVCPLNGFLIPKTKEKYYKNWGFYATALQFNEAVRKIFEFYLQNSVISSENELVFNFAINYFGCQIFDKRQSSKTCVPASQEETFLIYGHISYIDPKMEEAADNMVEKLEEALVGLMPLGSPCDYDPEKARKNPNIGKWIYRQNYEKLKEIKNKVDPQNRFDYGLFH